MVLFSDSSYDSSSLWSVSDEAAPDGEAAGLASTVAACLGSRGSGFESARFDKNNLHLFTRSPAFLSSNGAWRHRPTAETSNRQGSG